MTKPEAATVGVALAVVLVAVLAVVTVVELELGLVVIEVAVVLGRHCQYQSFWYVQTDPATQAVMYD